MLWMKEYTHIDFLHEYPEYDTKQSDGEASVMLKLWGMQSAPSLPSLPGPLWPQVVEPDRVLSMGQIELNSIITLNWIVWNELSLHLTVCFNCKLMLNWIVWIRTVLMFNCV